VASAFVSLTVAIHQPNHFPWLGYFAKIARADVFVFLDDVQFPKGSYVNRVQIAAADAPGWLTAPVRVSLGAPISAVAMAREDWARAHRDKLIQTYRAADAFKVVWPEVEAWLAGASETNLASANAYLVTAIASRLGLERSFMWSSQLDIPPQAADARLAEIVHAVAPGGRYLSGAGGANYQSVEVFAARGINLTYNDFAAPAYRRSNHSFIPGLSVLDALFHIGWDATAAIIRPRS
jgi:hypothetical protein